MTAIPDLLSRLDARRRGLMRQALAGDAISRLWLAPWKVMENPDPWQKDALSQLITQDDDVIMLCSRGAGKTYTLAGAAYVEACLGGFTLLLSRSERQALRAIRYAKQYMRRLNLVGVEKDNAHEIVFTNGGRILALPCSGDTIVGEHGVTILCIDEAARIKDEFYAVVTPMLAVSKEVTGIAPRLALLSTPFGQRGFFWEEWEGQRRQAWKRHRYPWTECPRLTPGFIEKERASHGDIWIEQEYSCTFTPTAQGFFDMERFESCIVKPEFVVDEDVIPFGDPIEDEFDGGVQW